jgi:AraC-like DNA-binding protein/mannose-6-phosphate isomerase-like protein (cupin superfamily)
MRQLFEILSNPFDSGYRVKKVQLEENVSTWFYHHEFELTYIAQGHGKRYVGNNIEDFSDGDLVLIGRNLIHRWLLDKSSNTKKEKNEAIVIQFQNSFLSDRLLEKPEMISIFQLIGKSKAGISFHSNTKTEVGSRMLNLLNMDIFDQTLELLKILKILSLSKNNTLLSLPVFSLDEINCNCSRISSACDYVNANFQKKITLTEIASKVNMSVPSFCRYFKKKTGKTFYSFVIEYRIAHACTLLQEKNMSITEICFESGYDNIVMFNRQFKSLTGTTPLNYKQMFNFS